jgi:hypothetical protein
MNIIRCSGLQKHRIGTQSVAGQCGAVSKAGRLSHDVHVGETSDIAKPHPSDLSAAMRHV